MPETTSVLLASALIAVYLFDSVLFLSIGEAVILTRRHALRGVSFGVGFELARRRPCLPNPLTPHRPVFRIEWDLSGGAVSPAREVAGEMQARLRSLRALGTLSALCGFAIVVVAPVALILQMNTLFLAAALACWLVALTAATMLFVKRELLGLTAWQVASIAFVAIVCLPCAANIARAVAAHYAWRLAASDLAELGFPAEEIPALRARVREALSAARHYVPEEGPHLGVIDAQLRRLGEHGS